MCAKGAYSEIPWSVLKLSQRILTYFAKRDRSFNICYGRIFQSNPIEVILQV